MDRTSASCKKTLTYRMGAAGDNACSHNICSTDDRILFARAKTMENCLLVNFKIWFFQINLVYVHN